ncbi:2OG-Fe dioxygenase family protein [Moraxella sp. Tifton1]|uniref:2OG-Fe dioxygenase family protein n=1 Tax=Moraxella oculi TaxID=2940516 RepID=A0ABW8U2K5_9GAMM|nr:2OG-Fe dioxygenase family protein [Moraxella sp. Tifton1]MCL1623085.1 2OG-Fe dioxygenase family protein [Moraxella sp. Tifton1]
MTALLQVGNLPTEIISPLCKDFDTLTPNLYKDGSYRLRRYSKIIYDKHTKEIALLRGSQFVQSEEFNKFQGGVVRQYDDLSDELLQSKGFLTIVDTFAKKGELPDSATIEIHQIRVVAKDPTTPTVTTPEGIHQDGYDRIGMFTINLADAQGGDLCVYKANDKKTLITTIPSKMGAYCVMDDDKLWHYGTDLIADKQSGHWDLFVLTASLSS